MDESSSSCSLPLALNSVIPTSASPHVAALAGYYPSHPTVLPSLPTLGVQTQKWAVIHLVLPKWLSYPFLGPHLSYTPCWSTPENHIGTSCYLLARWMVLGCSSQEPGQGLRCRWACRQSPCAERPRHTGQAFLLSLSHTRACQRLQMKCVHATPGQHPSHHANQTALTKKHTSEV